MAINTKDYPNKIKANLWANKDFKIFYYNFKIDGKKYRGLIDVSSKPAWNKRDRTTYAESQLLEIKDKKNNKIDDDITLDQFTTKHFELMGDGAWKTIKERYYDNYIKPRIGSKKISEFKQLHIKELINKISKLKIKGKGGIKKEPSPRTLKLALEVLNPIFTEAVANRLITLNPCEGVSVKVPSQKKIVANASDELVAIYKAIKKVFEHDPFYQAFYLFALQGRRKGEIINLKKKDISYEYNYYIIRDTKNDETQKMYLPNEIKELIVQFKDTPGEYLFTSQRTGEQFKNTRHSANKIRDELGNPDFTPHYLRNVITSAMGEQGLAGIYQSGALGHNNVNTVNKYTTINYLKGSEMASGVIAGIVKKD